MVGSDDDGNDDGAVDVPHARSRSFGGCATCRRRHLKCDEGRPACAVCRACGVACAGYEKNVFFFEDENAAEEGVSRYRRPLFTEQERRCMSDSLLSSVHPKSALWHIAQIEAACESLGAVEETTISHGPFGVFKLGSEVGSVPDTAPSSGDATGGASTEPGVDTRLAWSADRWDIPPLALAADLEWMPPSGASWWEIPIDAMDGEMVGAAVSCEDVSHLPDVSLIAPFRPSIGLDDRILGDPSSTVTSTTVPPDAVCLLQHYATVIVNVLTPFRHHKTPWHILFLPNCRNCLAALTLGEEVDAAAWAHFYGTLAVSASSMGAIYHSSMWREKARMYGDRARAHTQRMLHHAYRRPKAYKYKAVLMALLAMIQVAIFSRSRHHMEHYFMEAEQFIRLRGLARRRKSRKVRLLHHCYAFERIFYESTVVGGISDASSDPRGRVRRAVAASGVVVRGQDSLQFRLVRRSAGADLDRIMAAAKGRDAGENDLHLERPGAFAASLYPEIVGLPEPWIGLVSLVIRLGREKEAAAAEQRSREASLTLGEFLQYAKAIERRIDRLHRVDASMESGSTMEPTEDDVVPHLRRATRAALAIYFYRRVYDVDAALLQAHVRDVCACVSRCADHDRGAARFLWPAFIAACEAEEAAVQAAFRTWFRQAFRQSGLPLFDATLRDVEHVWRQRKGTSADGPRPTWLETLRRPAGAE